LFLKLARMLGKLLTAVAVLVGGSIAYFAIGSQGVRSFCADVAPGMPVSRLPSLAAAHGVQLRPAGFDPTQNVWMINVPVAVTIGDLVCAIRHDNQVVISAAMEGPGA
jgi:hypothetical protein